LEFFRQKDKYPKVDYVVFISWIPFLDWANPEKHKASDNKRELQTYLKKTGYLVIDNFLSLQNTIINFNRVFPGCKGVEYMFSPQFVKARPKDVAIQAVYVSEHEDLVSFDDSISDYDDVE